VGALSYNIEPTWYRIVVAEPGKPERTFLVHREKVVRRGKLRRYPFLVWTNPGVVRKHRIVKRDEGLA
jgi:hypothetical protein